MSKKGWKTGFVIRLQSGFYTVQAGTMDSPGEIVTCTIRGRLKKRRVAEDIMAIGDLVEFSIQPDGSGVIEEILERDNTLERLAPTPRGEYRQIFAAHVAQAVLVFACAEPEPSLRMLDRFLVIAEKQGISPLIVANKVDLVGLDAAKELFALYEKIGYPVVYASAKSGLGVEELRERFKGVLSALAGPSGVGKSSLLKKLQPGLDIAIRKVSDATSKGRHTTTVREMFRLDSGGYVVDMPGLRSLALWDTEPEELDGYFPELRPLVAECQFNNCTHQEMEPGCAVVKAVEKGEVSAQRYESYLRLRFGDDYDPG